MKGVGSPAYSLCQRTVKQLLLLFDDEDNLNFEF